MFNFYVYLITVFLFLTNITSPLNTDVKKAPIIKYSEELGSPSSANLSVSISSVLPSRCTCLRLQATRVHISGDGRSTDAAEMVYKAKKALSRCQSCFYSLEHDRFHTIDQAQPVQMCLVISS